MADFVLVTGISGFIAKHVALKLLNAGHEVRGTLRRLDRAEEVRAALRPQLTDPAALERLSFVQADLEQDDGWAAATAGPTVLMHTASPFPTQSPKDEALVIRPARDGTLRVLTAAHQAGIARVILTSSIVAITNAGDPKLHDETDWLDPTAAWVPSYHKSKLLAERAAWDFVADTGMALTTINPAMVMGPPLDRHYGDSIRLIERVLGGKDPMLPDYYLPFVDVRDIAEMHLRALERPQTAGRRYIGSGGTLSMPELGRVLKAAFPGRRIATRTAPGFAVRLLSLFDPSLRDILPQLGWVQQVSAAQAERDLDMRFISAEDAVRATGDWLVTQQAV